MGIVERDEGRMSFVVSLNLFLISTELFVGGEYLRRRIGVLFNLVESR